MSCSDVTIGTSPAAATTLDTTPAILDLRLVGLSRRLPVSRLAAHVLPWTLAAFAVAAASGLPTAAVRDLIAAHAAYPVLGFIGTERVNVTELNAGLAQLIDQ